MSMTNPVTKILDYFRRPQCSAKVAKERLQIIIAHERSAQNNPDYLTLLQKELLEVVSKYVSIDRDDIKLELQQKEGCSILELNIMLPSLMPEKAGTC